VADSNSKRNQEAEYILTTLYDFILEIIAVFIGVLGAFELDNYRDKKIEGRERARVLRLIRQEVESNQAVLRALDLVGPGDVVNFQLVRDIWGGVSDKLVLLNNDQLLDGTTLLYFEFTTFNRNIEMYNEHARAFQYATIEEKTRMMPELTRQFDHLKNLRKEIILPEISRALSLINSELAAKRSKVILSRLHRLIWRIKAPSNPSKTIDVPKSNGGKYVP